MQLNLNLNDTVKVVLTATCAKIYNEKWKSFTKIPKREGDVLIAQLWSLFQDFGEHMYLGMPEVPFKDCKIDFV